MKTNNTTFDSRENCNAIIESATNTLIVGCKNTIIPNSVTAIGLEAFRDCSNLSSISIPNSVTTIGIAAFEGCSGLTSCTIPNSIVTIDRYAFWKCSGLTSMTIPNSVMSIEEGAFESCTGLTSVTIGNGVISYAAFRNCSSLSSVNIGNGVTSIGQDAFIGCRSLSDVYCYAKDVPKTYIHWGRYSNPFENSIIASATLHVPAGSLNSYKTTEPWSNFGTIVAIEDDISNITFADANVKQICVSNWDTNGDGELSKTEAASVTDLGTVFKNNKQISTFDELQYFTGLRCIDYEAFAYCTNLTSITIPNNVTSIGENAFFKCSNLNFITISNSVTSIEQNVFFSCTSLVSVTIPSSVKSIYSNPFKGCTNLASIVVEEGNSKYDSRNNSNAIIETSSNSLIVGCMNTTIPNSVKKIEHWAFYGCSGLTSLTIPSSVNTIGRSAFYGCIGLTSLIIPTSVENVEYQAFESCTSLKNLNINCHIIYDLFGDSSKPKLDKITFGANVKEIRSRWNKIITNETKVCFNNINQVCKMKYGIESNPLYYAKKLYLNGSEITDVNIPSDVDSICDYAFSGCSGIKSLNIPNNVKSIGSSAFYECNGLTSLTLGNGVTNIGKEAFYGCRSIVSSLTIPNGMTSIDDGVFWGCTGLTSVTIPSSVTSIGGHAFSNCTGMTSITIGNGVTSIGFQAFYNCSGLTSITIPNNVTTIDNMAFQYCTNLAAITIPRSVTSIGDYAFAGCRGLTSVTIPNSVISIGNDAFQGCTGLISIIIPNSLTSINNGVFWGCSGLTSITIPESVTSIGDDAFYGCHGLSFVKVESASPFDIYSNTFPNRANANLYVPKGSKAAYAAANYWKEFVTIKEFPNPDVNQDGDVDVLDVMDIARFVVGTPAQTFVEFLADINEDGYVNLGDAVTLVNEIAGDQNFVKGWAAPSGFETNDVLSLTGRDGILSLNLENERYYTAFQFDLYVPEGADVTQLLLNAERKQKHQLLYNKVEEGHYRVAALSTSNNEFNGNNGELLNISLTGADNSEVSIRGIHFFDAQGKDYLFDDICGASPTSIRQIDNGELIIPFTMLLVNV